MVTLDEVVELLHHLLTLPPMESKRYGRGPALASEGGEQMTT